MHRKADSLAGAIALALALLAVPAAAAPTPEQACEAGKNQAAGKYSACLAKAEKSFVTHGDMLKYAGAVAQCANKLIPAWNRLESKAADLGTSCPSSGDQDDVQDFVEACVASVAAAVAGGTLPLDAVTCSDELSVCEMDLSSCSGSLAACEGDLGIAQQDLTACDDGLAVCGSLSFERLAKGAQTTCFDDIGEPIPCAGTGQDGDHQAGLARADVDNGDGTITDRLTGLMWEKLSNDSSIHDMDNVYLNHTGAFAKIAALNLEAYAGYSDWRLPNRRELDSILDLGRIFPAVGPAFHQGCSGSCSVLACSCTRSNPFWSSSTRHGMTDHVWVINFADGDVYEINRTGGSSYGVRAVRSVY